MAAHTGPIITVDELDSMTISDRIAGFSGAGMIGVRIPELNNEVVSVWVDDNYTTGGWIMVLANRQYTAGMTGLRYSDAINKINYRTNGTNDGSNDKSGPKQSLADMNAFVGLKYWPYLAKRESMSDIRVAQFVSTSPVTLSDTSNHTYRAEWSFTGWNSEYAFVGRSSSCNLTNTTQTPGMWNYHAASTTRGLTTFDVDHDENGGNCATYYNNNPWWYGSCWSGNYFAGGGYADRPYWHSSGGDNHAYGAVYIK